MIKNGAPIEIYWFCWLWNINSAPEHLPNSVPWLLELLGLQKGIWDSWGPCYPETTNKTPITQTKAPWIHKHTINHQHKYFLIIPFKFLFVSPIKTMTFEAAAPCKLVCMPLTCIAVVLWGALIKIWKKDEAHCYQKLLQQIKIKAKPDWIGCERLH